MEAAAEDGRRPSVAEFSIQVLLYPSLPPSSPKLKNKHVIPSCTPPSAADGHSRLLCHKHTHINTQNPCCGTAHRIFITDDIYGKYWF